MYIYRSQRTHVDLTPFLCASLSRQDFIVCLVSAMLFWLLDNLTSFLIGLSSPPSPGVLPALPQAVLGGARLPALPSGQSPPGLLLLSPRGLLLLLLHGGQSDRGVRGGHQVALLPAGPPPHQDGAGGEL